MNKNFTDRNSRINNIKSISGDLSIFFNNKNVLKGELLPLSLVQKEPIIKYNNINPGKYYTLVIVDPDAPIGYHIHLCIYNITTNSPGFKYYIYSPPSPPANTGPYNDGRHRYYCIIYEQSDKITGNKPVLERGFKSYDDFKKLMGVVLTPVAYKYFVSQNNN